MRHVSIAQVCLQQVTFLNLFLMLFKLAQLNDRYKLFQSLSSLFVVAAARSVTFTVVGKSFISEKLCWEYKPPV